MATSSRSTNGHRFVFHSGEIVGTERYYIPSEPGVMPYEPIPRLPLPVSMPLASQILSDFPHHNGDYADWRSRQQNSASSTRYLPTPPLEPMFSPPHFAPNPDVSSEDVNDSYSDEDEIDSDSDIMPALHSPRASAPEHANLTALRMFYDNGGRSGTGHGAEGDVFYGPEAPRKLKAGEPLFWHNLVKHGEIPGVTNDPRARKGFEPIVDLYMEEDEPILFGR